MLDLMQVAAYTSKCIQAVYRTKACTVREVERTLMYQQFVVCSVLRLTSLSLWDFTSFSPVLLVFPDKF